MLVRCHVNVLSDFNDFDIRVHFDVGIFALYRGFDATVLLLPKLVVVARHPDLRCRRLPDGTIPID